MRDYSAFKKATIRYWERRRILYNLALLPPAVLGYLFADTFNWVGDPHEMHYYFIFSWFLLCGIGANICYTFAYVLEFFLGNDVSTSRWLRYGRKTAFVSGILFSMLLALMGGVNIAHMEWYYGIKHGR